MQSGRCGSSCASSLVRARRSSIAVVVAAIAKLLVHLYAGRNYGYLMPTRHS